MKFVSTKKTGESIKGDYSFSMFLSACWYKTQSVVFYYQTIEENGVLVC